MSMNTKLILLETVDGLGRPGDQVSVKTGFARNFLLPQRLAVVATRDSMRMLGKLQAKAEAEERALVTSMEDLASKVKGLEVAVSARATEEGHLFGSVTEKDIHLAIGEAGWDVPLRAVRLTAHLKDAGVHEVTLHLHGEIMAAIQVEVVPVDVEGHQIDPYGTEAESEPESADGADDAADATKKDESASTDGPAPAADGQAAATADA